MLTHAKLTSFLRLFVLSQCDVRFSVFFFFSFTQDVVYQSLQSVVDWFREAVGIPMEKKYNSVLFGGILE